MMQSRNAPCADRGPRISRDHLLPALQALATAGLPARAKGPGSVSLGSRPTAHLVGGDQGWRRSGGENTSPTCAPPKARGWTTQHRRLPPRTALHKEDLTVGVTEGVRSRPVLAGKPSSRPGRYCIRLSRVLTRAVSWARLRLARRKDLNFFPADAIGAAKAQDGKGAMLTLHLEGLAEPIETDIAGDKKIFRCRGEVGKFFARCGLSEGNSVVIERLSAYEYRILPGR
jgi:hypothetical protein